MEEDEVKHLEIDRKTDKLAVTGVPKAKVSAPLLCFSLKEGSSAWRLQDAALLLHLVPHGEVAL